MPPRNDNEEIKQAMFNANLIKAAQSGMIVVALVGGVLGPLYSWFIQPQFDQLNKRQEKVEQQVNDIQKQQNGLDKNVAIIVEQNATLKEQNTLMRQDIRDIKESLKH